MPRYFFDIKDGYILVDPLGFDCESDVDAIDRASRSTSPPSIQHVALQYATMRDGKSPTCPYIQNPRLDIRPNKRIGSCQRFAIRISACAPRASDKYPRSPLLVRLLGTSLPGNDGSLRGSQATQIDLAPSRRNHPFRGRLISGWRLAHEEIARCSADTLGLD
jgi:hypothetical protein